MKEIINELKETNFKRTSKAKRDEVIDLLNQVRYVLFPNFYEKIILNMLYIVDYSILKSH